MEHAFVDELKLVQILLWAVVVPDPACPDLGAEALELVTPGQVIALPGDRAGRPGSKRWPGRPLAGGGLTDGGEGRSGKGRERKNQRRNLAGGPTPGGGDYSPGRDASVRSMRTFTESSCVYNRMLPSLRIAVPREKPSFAGGVKPSFR